MKRKHQKNKKTKNKKNTRQTILDNLTDSIVKGTWPLRRGQTFKIKNLLMQRADNIVKTGTTHNKSKLATR